MSWFSSWFSSPKTPLPSPAPLPEKRILEESQPSTPTSTSTTAPSTSIPSSREPQIPKPDNNSQIANPNRNKILFGAGLGFFALSILITRRSFARKRLAAQAEFYSDAPGHHVSQSKKVNGAMEAMEALNIATINVLSAAMMVTGGTLWYLDINSMQEARMMLRGGLGVDGSGRTEKEAEEDFEEWMAATLSRKEAKEKKKTSNQ